MPDCIIVDIAVQKKVGLVIFIFGNALTGRQRGKSTKTGMNRSSAVMYIYVVDCMLKGNVYKRAISTKATEKYFKEIYEEYGKSGLCNALQATREHIRYRKNLGHTVEGLVTLCVQYEMYLD